MRLTPLSCPICHGSVEERDFFPNAYECTQCSWVHYIVYGKDGKLQDQPKFAEIHNAYAKEQHRLSEWRKWWGIK